MSYNVAEPTVNVNGIGLVRHPYWTQKIQEWNKWRLVYEGGDEFIDNYLERYSKRESPEDFLLRKRYAPTPAFAKTCLLEIRNSIFQRLCDVERHGGSDIFQAAVDGENVGVDLHGSSMNQFLGMQVLPELLVMARVGVFVDMPQIEGPTLADQNGKQPYYYVYQAEDILSWNFRKDRPDEFDCLTVRDFTQVYHDLSGLPNGTVERVRHIFINPLTRKVNIQWWYTNDEGRESRQDYDGNAISEPIQLDLEIIPFVLTELSDSLLADTANHQIALLNLESSDISYLLKSGYPFYVEQRDNKEISVHLKGPALPGDDGKGMTANAGNSAREIIAGSTQGRFYSGDKAPEFINPSSEPIVASMAKQAALKEDIRVLMQLSLSNVKAKMASQGSKQIDNQGLEAGMAAIGLVLEWMERKLAKYWSIYEGRAKPPTIKYPQKYSLKTDADLRADAQSLADLRDVIPSEKYQRAISQQIAITLLSTKLSQDDLAVILKEISAAPTVTAKPEVLFQLITLGVLDLVSAAGIFGMPASNVAKAAAEHADRIARIAAAQTPQGSLVKSGQDELQTAPPAPGARGVTDLSADPNAGKDERAVANDTTTKDVPQDQTRGAGK